MTPYQALPPKAFWRSAVAEADLTTRLNGIWRPKFPDLANMAAITTGSCFAQHIARALLGRGMKWLNLEPAPTNITAEKAMAHGYGIFSFRTGNIYTAALLRQWLLWALGDGVPPREIWVENGAYFDPFRPGLDGDGFASAEDVYKARQVTLDAIRSAIAAADILIFTMGLTEAWQNTAGGYVYPTCPGTIRGQYRADLHRMTNSRFSEIRQQMLDCFELLRQANPNIRVLLTVSPQPLTATASNNHVLNANCHSKSLLRAVAGELAETHDFVDYFPSYELVASHPFRACAYSANLRTVTPDGVDFVMDHFFAAMDQGDQEQQEKPTARSVQQAPEEDVICEDAILDYYLTP